MLTAYVRAWDEKIENGVDGMKKPGSLSAWDGRKESNISFILEKHYCVKGLGTSGIVALSRSQVSFAVGVLTGRDSVLMQLKRGMEESRR